MDDDENNVTMTGYHEFWTRKWFEDVRRLGSSTPVFVFQMPKTLAMVLAKDLRVF